jgi:hypothetical protein
MTIKAAPCATIVIDSFALIVFGTALESTTCATKLYVPVAVGVPEMVPF